MHLEHYEPRTSWTSSLRMFVAGAAVGAVSALIMAPATGRESRAYLRKQSRKMADDFGSRLDKLVSFMRWSQERASSAMRVTADQAKAAINKAKSFRSGEAPHEGGSPAETAATTGGNKRPTPIASPS
nr:hypothetical protein [uncultured bacterium]